jgi:tetratricopeptide (TPR) repeat protein
VLRESRRLIGTPGYEPQGRLLVGLLFARSGRAVAALQELQHAARSEVTAVEAMTAAAECYYSLGRYVEASDVARTALARDAQALDARRWLAAAYYDLGAMDMAAAELEYISTSAPGDARPERLLGLIDKDGERFQDAAAHYRESLRRDPYQPDRATIMFELAESLVKLSRFDDALETLRKCDRTAPTLTLEAACELGLGRMDEAENRLRRALEYDPLYLPANLQHGAWLLLQGRTEEAVGVLEGAVRLAPYGRQPHFQLSQAYALQGEHEKAAEQVRLMRDCEAVEREFADLHKAASQKPDDAEVRYRLGVLAGKLAKPQLARMWFRSVLAIEPNHARARAALAETDGSQARPF